MKNRSENIEIIKLILKVKERMKSLDPASLDGQKEYSSLLTLYSMVDFEATAEDLNFNQTVKQFGSK